MLLFTYGTSTTKSVIPYDTTKTISGFVPGKIPPAKYHRDELTCGTECSTTAVVKIVDCNACKPTRSANTNMNKTYYASSSSYLRSRSKKYEQALTARNYNSTTHTITKDGCDTKYNCGVYKRSNGAFQDTGAVSSAANTMRTKYQNVVTAYNANSLRPRYHGEATMNVQFKPQDPVCHSKTGSKTTC